MTPRLAPYLFVAPAILMVLVFLYLPILVSLALSFSDWNFIRPEARFVGLENYRAVLSDANFHAALRNTGIYTLILAPLQVVIPLLLARLLVQLGKSRLANFYKSALFLPTIIAFSIAGATWLWLFNPLTGLFNIVLETAGFAPQRWLEDPALAIWSVSATVFWKTFGLNMLLFLAAFTAIPPELTEAARIDGARPARILWRIEVPLISPTLFFVIVTTVLGVMDDLLGAVDVMTGGGPIDATTNLLFYLWEKGLRFFQFGHAGATTMIIAAMIGLITWAQFKLLERKVHYG
jgi:multiple sugar transport system permease protein/sn-glycerol 3-phosphate transport system permease protein